MRQLVGREAELAELVGLLDAAATGRGALVLITGEAGIGKSALLDAACEAARARGAAVLRARCWDSASRAFWPWTQVLCAVEDPPAPAPALDGGPGGDAPHDSSPERLAVFDRVAAWLRALARRAPVVVAIEDLHGADESSLLLLQYLAIELSGARVLFAATVRDEDATASRAAFAARRAELERVARRVALRGLGAVALAALVGPDAPWPCDALARATGGNPLFALELAAALRAHAREPGAPLPLPETVRTVLGARLGALGAAARRVLAVAALLDDPLDPGLIAEVAELPPTAVLDALDEAVRGGVLVEASGARRARVFRHDLVREAAAALLTGGARAAVHLRAGDALETRGAASEAVARHLLRALPLGDAARAAARGADAGRAAADACAWENACAWYEQALAALEGSGAPAVQLLDLLVPLAETRLAAGALEPGRAAVARAIELARRAQLPRAFARAVLALGAVQQMGGVDPRFVSQLETALAALDPGAADDDLRAALCARLAAARQPCEQYWRPHELAREAVALARKACAPRVLAAVIDSARNAFRVVDDLAERRALDEEQLRLAVAQGAPGLELNARRRLVVAALETGRIDDAFEHVRAVERLGARLGSPLSRWHALQLSCGIATMQGRFDEAEGFLSAALAESEAGRALFGAAFVMNPVVLLPIAIARARGQRALLEPVLGHDVLPPPLRLVLYSTVRAALGRAREARSDCERIAAAGVSLATGLWQRLALAEVGARLGDEPPAYLDATLAVLEPLAGRAVCWFPLGVCEGAYDRLRADLLCARGEHARAAPLYESAIALETRLGAVPWLARTRLAYARLLASPGPLHDATRARALRDEARAAFAALEMEIDLERADAMDAGTPARAARGEPARARPVLRLEGEVWSVRYDTEQARLPDLDGLRYLAWLVEHAGTAATAVELLALSRRGPGTAPPASVETPMIDAKARAAYRERVAELRETLAEAEGANDLGRAERARHELEQLISELGRASGLHGRERALGASSERARVNVTLRLRKAIAKIAAQCPALGAHLEAAVRTGASCCYAPGEPPG